MTTEEKRIAMELLQEFHKKEEMRKEEKRDLKYQERNFPIKMKLLKLINHGIYGNMIDIGNKEIHALVIRKIFYPHELDKFKKAARQ